jgi:hypothetical protein
VFQEYEHRAGPEIGAPCIFTGQKQKLPVALVFVKNRIGSKSAYGDFAPKPRLAA